jgi:hypothetical protein
MENGRTDPVTFLLRDLAKASEKSIFSPTSPIPCKLP